MHVVLRNSCLPSPGDFSSRWQLSIQCYWDHYTETFYVTVGCLMAKDRAETSVLVFLGFTAALSGWSMRYHCDDVIGATSSGIWTIILSGIILVASHGLLMPCYHWCILSEAYPIILSYCSVGWGLVFFHGFTCDCHAVEEQRGSYNPGDFPEQ